MADILGFNSGKGYPADVLLSVYEKLKSNNEHTDEGLAVVIITCNEQDMLSVNVSDNMVSTIDVLGLLQAAVLSSADRFLDRDL